MADITFATTIGTLGTYNGQPLRLTAETPAEVTIIEGLTLTLSADKALWVDHSPLTFTVTITNNGEYDYILQSLSTSAFDTALVTLVPNSVTVGGAVFPGYTFSEGLLTLTFTDTPVTTGGSLVITFQMSKVLPEPPEQL